MTRYIADSGEWSTFSTESNRAIVVHTPDQASGEHFTELLNVLTEKKSGVDVFHVSAWSLNGPSGYIDRTSRTFFILTERQYSDLSGLYHDITIAHTPLGVCKYIYDVSTYKTVTGEYIVNVVSSINHEHRDGGFLEFFVEPYGSLVAIRIRRDKGELLSYSRMRVAGESSNYTYLQIRKPDLSILWRC